MSQVVEGDGPSGSASSSSSDRELGLAVAAQRKERRRASSKASIARSEPIQAAAPGGRGATTGGGGRAGGRGGRGDAAFRQAWRRTAGDLSEEEQRDAVVRALQVFRLLPASSSYAQHRIRVLEKALQLLDKASEARSAEESDELQRLLSELTI